jgi:hypothetical protein
LTLFLDQYYILSTWSAKQNISLKWRLLIISEKKNVFFCFKYIWLLGNNTTAYLIWYQKLLLVFSFVEVHCPVIELKCCACIILFIPSFLKFAYIFNLLMHDLYLVVLIGECTDTICLLTGISQQTSIICAQKYEILRVILLLLLLNACSFISAWAKLVLFDGYHHCQRQGCKFRIDLCLAFSSGGSFTCHICCDTWLPF